MSYLEYLPNIAIVVEIVVEAYNYMYAATFLNPTVITGIKKCLECLL